MRNSSIHLQGDGIDDFVRLRVGLFTDASSLQRTVVPQFMQLASSLIRCDKWQAIRCQLIRQAGISRNDSRIVRVIGFNDWRPFNDSAATNFDGVCRKV